MYEDKQDQISIEEIAPILADTCIYYYIAYNEKILHYQNIKIPYIARAVIIKQIIEAYNMRTDGTVYDIDIMNWPYNKKYYTTTDKLDIINIIDHIDWYMEENKEIYGLGISITVISLRDHPIENPRVITHDWIKRTIDELK